MNLISKASLLSIKSKHTATRRCLSLKSITYRMNDYSKFLGPIAAARAPSLLRLTFGDHVGKKDVIVMAGGLPNPATFPVMKGTFTLTDGRELTIPPELMEIALQYGNSDGYEPLLEQLHSLTKRLHSPPCWSSSSLLVTCGSQAGLCMAMEMLMNHGDYVIIEEPCYCGALAVIFPYKPNILAIEADGEGMKPEKLRAALSRWKPEEVRNATKGVPKFIYTNPNGCNPSGGVVSTERKKEIYKIASEYNILILEDDPYYFVQFRDPKDFPPSYLSLDVDGRVIRFDSFSKTMSAGLRVGYLTGPQPLVERITWHQQISVSHAPVLSQIIISEILKMMGEDGFIKHAIEGQKFYEERRDAIVAAAKKHLSGLCEWLVPAGGMFLWVKVVGVKDTVSIVKKIAATKNVILVPGVGFLADSESSSPYVRISFSVVDPKDMDEGLRRMASVIREEKSKMGK